MTDSRSRSGWIEVICGCMFSGKTEELIRRINRAVIARQKVQIFKPLIDKRYHLENVVSHDERKMQSTPVSSAKDILQLTNDCHVVGIDEAQFFDEEIVNVCNQLANAGKRVIVAGLDMDFEGKPFGQIPNLLAIAEFVTKLHAICAVTGDLASYSFRITDNKEKIIVGEKDHYQARSRSAFVEGMSSKKR